MKDYYKILGIDKNAKQEQIKTAYKKLAMQYHPDRNPNSGELMAELNEAYNSLETPEKRKEYDDFLAGRSKNFTTIPTPSNKTNEILNRFDDLKF